VTIPAAPLRRGDGQNVRRALKIPVVLPMLAFAIAAALRFLHLGHNSLWIDEFASLITARAPLPLIPESALRYDAFELPMYFWLLHGIVHGYGESEWALRFISAAGGALTVPVIWLLARDLSRSVWVANMTGLLLATNPLHLWYSQEARPYALMVFFGSIALLCLVRALERDAVVWWLGFSVFSALAVLLHVTGGVFLVVGCLWALQASGTAVHRRLALSALGVFVVTLPFLVILGRAVLHAGGTGSPTRPLTGLEVPYTLFTFVTGYSFGPPVRDLQDLGWQVAVARYPVQTALAGTLLFWLALLVARSLRRSMVPFGVLLTVPLLLMIAGSLITTKSYNVRYTVPALTGFLGIVALALEPLPARRRGLASATVLGLFLWADAQWYLSPDYWKDDSRAAAACLARQLSPGSTVAVAPNYMWSLLAHYSPESKRLRYVGVVDQRGLEAQLPGALAVTRAYDLPVAEPQLAQVFARLTGAQRVERVVGYRLYFISSPGNLASCASRGDRTSDQ